MGTLIKEIFTGFSEAIKGLASGIKDAFMQILYVDPAAETLVVSEFAKFGFVMLGLSLAIGLVWGAVRLIRR